MIGVNELVVIGNQEIPGLLFPIKGQIISKTAFNSHGLDSDRKHHLGDVTGEISFLFHCIKI